MSNTDREAEHCAAKQTYLSHPKEATIKLVCIYLSARSILNIFRALRCRQTAVKYSAEKRSCACVQEYVRCPVEGV